MKAYFKELVTVYTTTKVVGVKSPVLAVCHVVLLILVWCALLGSIHLDLRKIYQKHCPVHGVVLTKVKGFASTENLTDNEIAMPNAQAYRQIWDPTGIVYPASGGEGETGSFVIVTNLIVTPNQTLSKCAGPPISHCKNDSDCEEGFKSPATQGIFTGRCCRERGTCEIRGWCPIEQQNLPRNEKHALLDDVKDFTVMLKNTVDFPGCRGPQLTNTPNEITKSYFKKCKFDKEKDPLCPIFRIGDVVEWSGDNFTKTAIKGGVFRIKIFWDCDLDFQKNLNECKPTYQFLRVDDRERKVFSGMNFRSAEVHSEDQRTLRKLYALKILVDLEGEARQFDFFQLVINSGAMIGIFSVATLVCDCILNLLIKTGSTKGCRKLSQMLHDASKSKNVTESGKVFCEEL